MKVYYDIYGTVLQILLFQLCSTFKKNFKYSPKILLMLTELYNYWDLQLFHMLLIYCNVSLSDFAP